MKRIADRPDSEVRSLLVSVFFGLGINMLTAETASWWGPLQPLARYPYVWVPAALVAWVGWLLWRRRLRRPTWTSTENPYPGLAPFTADRASVFFGRDAETREVLTRLERSGVTAPLRLVSLVGPSGSGKSSLIRAGILPNLSKRWQVIGPFRPAADPFLALAKAAGGPATDVGRTARLLRDEARLNTGTITSHGSRALLSRSLLNVEHRPVLLVIDQFEDLFTLVNENDRRSFVQLLTSALSGQPALHCLVAMRSDTLSAASELQPLLFTRPVAVGPLEPRHIREAIVRPAAAAGVSFESGLVDVMVAEATIGDALPLLGHLLQRLYAESVDGVITFAQYDRAGRVGGAIAEHADAVYQALLTVHSQAAVDRVLLQCVGIEGDEPVRRTITYDSLDEIGKRVMEEFRAARLVVDVQDGSAFEFAHDALFRQWTTLADLVTQNRHQLRQITLLEQRAIAWELAPNADDLLRGQRLDEAIRLIEALPPSSALSSFVAASRLAENKERERRADHAAAWAQQLRERDPELAGAVVNAAISELAPSDAALLTRWALTATGETRRLPIGHTESVTSLAWVPASGQLRSADGEGVVCTWDPAGELVKVNRVRGSEWSGRALLSRDGEYVLVVEERNAVGIWRIADEAYLGRRQCGVTWFNTFSWASDNRFAGQFAYRCVDVYSLRNGVPEHLFEIPVEDVQATSWSPTGDLLAIATSNSLEVYSIAETVEKLSHTRVSWGCSSLTWSPDCRHLAVVAGTEPPTKFRAFPFISFGERRLTIYEVATGKLMHEWEVDAGGSVAWSPAGDCIAYARSRGASHYVELRDIGVGQVRRRRRRGEVRLLTWSADGKRLAFADDSHGPEIWDLRTNTFHRLPSGSLRAVAWSPEGTAAVVGQVRTAPWIVGEKPKSSLKLRDGTSALKLRWSPGGTLVAGSDLTIVHLWDPATGDRIGAVGPFPCSRRGSSRRRSDHLLIRTFEWSPDGTQIAIAVHDFWGHDPGFVAVWDTLRRALITMDVDGEPDGPLVWSPDGTRLVGSVDRGDIAIWQAATGDLQQRWKTGYERIAELSWSPEASRLAVAVGNQIEIWDVYTGHAVARCIGHSDSVDALCWSRDGSRLASAGGDRALYIWQPEQAKPLAVLGLPRQILIDLRWPNALIATFDDGTVITWQVPELGQPPIEPSTSAPQRTLTNDERQRFGLPLRSPAEPG